jgi:hypothetical protein
MHGKLLRSPLLIATAVLALGVISRGEASPNSRRWDAAGAARYLDQRLEWWRGWQKSARDHDTRCISCHTSLPVALARPVLRGALGEAAPTANERAVYADISKRVGMWRDVAPFYDDQHVGLPKTSESRAVEAVLNALFLVTRDIETTGHLSADTRQAFANLWPLQIQRGDLDGGFAWLTFKLEPWESETATYWGASLAALAVARAPDNYAASPEIAENVDGLRSYLRTAFEKESSLFTRMLVLWADSNLHGVIDAAQREKTIEELLAVQNADGGWGLKRLSGWQRKDGSVIGDESDGFATALITVALKDAGLATKSKPIRASRKWLITHQNAETGAMPATSINKLREPTHDAYLFMTDAATGFATLALADELPKKR